MSETIHETPESDDVVLQQSAPALSLVQLFSRVNRPPQLTDDELTRIRAMLDAFEKISTVCPVAHRILTR